MTKQWRTARYVTFCNGSMIELIMRKFIVVDACEEVKQKTTCTAAERYITNLCTFVQRFVI